ncbi:MAG: DUF4851 domain-containing protein [Desulfovibrio sp.]|nr:DUF4851 domain-containing protein [Desulfovibrio sp.]
MTLRSIQIGILVLLFCFGGCTAGLKRGMLDSAYVSSARPAIMLEARDMPLVTAGRGMADLMDTSVISGLPIHVWLAVYGKGIEGPLAIVAQAQTPHGWYWDSIMRRPFSVNECVELLGGMAFQACTFILDSPYDPFIAQAWNEAVDERPVRWLVRAFAARCNFDEDKIILEYREPLPSYIASLESLPYGHADALRLFEQRARKAFAVSLPPQTIVSVRDGFPVGIEWRYMGERFLGTASKYELFDPR